MSQIVWSVALSSAVVLWAVLAVQPKRKLLDHFTRRTISEPNLSHHERFEYTPLQGPTWTRVVELFPYRQSQFGPVGIRLKQIDLDDPNHPAYIAISYAWADQTPTEVIECHGKQLSITPILLFALKRLLDEGRNVYVWADALSINQSQDPESTAERAAQVRKMHVIFSQAEEVVVNFGDISRNDEDMLDHLQRYATVDESRWNEACRQHTEYFQDQYSMFRRQLFDPFAEFGLPSSSSLFWAQLDEFLSRHWFRRLWVIQEYVLARTLRFMIGQGQVLPQAIDTGIERASHHLSTTVPVMNLRGPSLRSLCWSLVPRITHERSISVPFIVAQRSANLGTSIDTSLWYLGMLTRHRASKAGNVPDAVWKEVPFCRLFFPLCGFRASQKRDKVYALLGLSSDRHAAELRVDYEEPEDKVAERVAWYTITQGYGLALLYRHSLSANLLGHGWRLALTDLSFTLVDQLSDLIEVTGEYSTKLFNASGSTALQMRLLNTSGNENRLCIRGEVVATVSAVCPVEVTSYKDASVAPASFSATTFLKIGLTGFYRILRVYNWKTQIDSGGLQRSYSDEDWWRAVLLDIVRSEDDQAYRYGSPEARRYKAMALEDFIILLGARANLPDFTWESYGTFVQRFPLTLRQIKMGSGRCLALSSVGPCLVPRHCEPGDVACIFYGCPTPFVLRPSHDGTYMLLGACYVHNMMDGQALERPERKGEEFVLLSGGAIGTGTPFGQSISISWRGTIKYCTLLLLRAFLSTFTGGFTMPDPDLLVGG